MKTQPARRSGTIAALLITAPLIANGMAAGEVLAHPGHGSATTQGSPTHYLVEPMHGASMWGLGLLAIAVTAGLMLRHRRAAATRS